MTGNAQGRSLELFFIDGKPDGMLTAEVFKGSENTSYGQLYVELVKTGVLQEQVSHRVFSVNYSFKSPSAAGAVVNGRPTSGPLAWKVKGTSKTYKDWEAETLAREQGGEG